MVAKPKPGNLLRLNQALAKTGLYSRRAADEVIRSGKVTVDGKPVLDFHFTIDPDVNKLAVNGKPLEIRHYEYVVMYKPRGIVTTCAKHKGQTSILELLPPAIRHLRPAGRLDADSQGLIVLTNDGDLTQRITHPKNQKSKTYVCVVKGKIGDYELDQLRRGIPLEDGMTQRAKVKLLHHTRYESTVEIIIYEGRNRQVRRMFAYVGHPVISLVRTGIGRLQLGKMDPGSFRFLSQAQVEALFE
jgi:23S rRNA pseudouridine2605 synthase